ncbi:MAG: hypothetical protein CME62_10820 [Halobacteriovoraceae bacterium]|nr:hypothetical protein [Halobacteriovoraceae bacterium]
MKKLMLLVCLMLGTSVMANDKIAYIVNELDQNGSYVLCENSYEDFKMTSYLVMKSVIDQEIANWLDMEKIEAEDEDQVCAKLSLAEMPDKKIK